MRKAILIMLLTAVSNSAVAEWAKVDEGNGMATYVDMTTIQKKGNVVKMWEMSDYKVVQNYGFLSAITQREYDCEEVQFRLLSLAFFSENMGHGQVIDSFRHTSEWEPLLPSSLGKVMWKRACNKE